MTGNPNNTDWNMGHDKITIKAQKNAECGKCGTYDKLCSKFCYKSDKVEEFKEMAAFVIEETCRWMADNHIKYPNTDIDTEIVIRNYKQSMEQ